MIMHKCVYECASCFALKYLVGADFFVSLAVLYLFLDQFKEQFICEETPFCGYFSSHTWKLLSSLK